MVDALKLGSGVVVSVVDGGGGVGWQPEGGTHVDFLTTGARECGAILEVDKQSGVGSVPASGRAGGGIHAGRIHTRFDQLARRSR